MKFRKHIKKQSAKSRREIDWEHDPLWDIIGTGTGKETDIAENHDHYLYGWPKKKEKQKMIRMSVMLTPEQHRVLHYLSKKRKVSVSFLIREAIDKFYMAKMKKEVIRKILNR